MPKCPNCGGRHGPQYQEADCSIGNNIIEIKDLKDDSEQKPQPAPQPGISTEVKK
ncbi:hypothetical protein AYL99_06198 [Fonsecaea erecta]|uniref:Uncharacterized protein n=1 Tax=Fonsecaea erecta TaxID=1367422 RepID=A0A178ZHE1_9EURO|nr:hypothetical protein AYL99_06198 [Fonsecaea erecta]OAP58901.1 hypothetical protein AYL99_06198 [Fonsecaea erecta]